MKRLMTEIRLMMCGWCFGLILKLAPKDNKEGIFIISLVHIWAGKSIADEMSRKFKVGDIVSRDGTDEQEILEIDYGWGTLKVRCIKEPLLWNGGCDPWIKIGEEEDNLIMKYELIRRKGNP